MKRWVICKTYLDTQNNSYEPTVAKYTDNFRCWNKSGTNWQICQVGVQDLTAMAADADCHVLPDLTLDFLLSSLTQAQRTALKNKLAALGVDTTEDIQNSWTVRDLLKWLGRKLQPNMDPERGDVSDF